VIEVVFSCIMTVKANSSTIYRFLYICVSPSRCLPKRTLCQFIFRASFISHTVSLIKPKCRTIISRIYVLVFYCLVRCARYVNRKKKVICNRRVEVYYCNCLSYLCRDEQLPGWREGGAGRLGSLLCCQAARS
jgi:hypothetical protein